LWHLFKNQAQNLSVCGSVMQVQPQLEFAEECPHWDQMETELEAEAWSQLNVAGQT
jgi:hypothetical protein